MGTAVVNDATATYHNPAALTLLPTSQMIALGSVAHFRTQFTGQLILPANMGYPIYKNLIIDGSYAHAFIHQQNINITNNTSIITGINRGARDAISVKLTLNI